MLIFNPFLQPSAVHIWAASRSLHMEMAGHDTVGLFNGLRTGKWALVKTVKLSISMGHGLAMFSMTKGQIWDPGTSIPHRKLKFSIRVGSATVARSNCLAVQESKVGPFSRTINCYVFIGGTGVWKCKLSNWKKGLWKGFPEYTVRCISSWSVETFQHVPAIQLS